MERECEILLFTNCRCGDRKTLRARLRNVDPCLRLPMIGGAKPAQLIMCERVPVAMGEFMESDGWLDVEFDCLRESHEVDGDAGRRVNFRRGTVTRDPGHARYEIAIGQQDGLRSVEGLGEFERGD
ncbi:hypothetical protein [Sphingomonas koreensis]|uniref:hypothetical protein n=1 Tax=Sphingomonas koreensis TaxID=93064 RepID=UPI000F7F3845|nr:hypothetical protein [Sphingomonas koreensis]